MNGRESRWLALDVGGANIKAAHSLGESRVLPFELWKRPDDLPEVLAALESSLPPYDRLALTMTAELCDCYATKSVGVNAVLDGVLAANSGRPVHVWGVDGGFHDIESVRARPALAAAANWLALATIAARLIPQHGGLMIDIGSTTTDLIPVRDGHAVARGTTDTERLQNGELVYAGVRRTPVHALASELPFRGVPTGLAAELFASTLDVYLTLGEIPSDPKDISTADGRPASADAARDRLARMIGTDRDGFTEQDALAFAQAAHEALLERLAVAAARACRAVAVEPHAAVVSGSGEFLGRLLAQRLLGSGGRVVSLRDAWGPTASSAGCAYALMVLARESTLL